MECQRNGTRNPSAGISLICTSPTGTINSLRIWTRISYSAGAVEIWEHDSLQPVLGRLLRLLLKNPPCFETDAPRPVEITMFEQAEERRYIVNLLNHQQELPNIPIEGIKVRLRMDGKRGKDLRLLPGGAQLPFVQEADTVEFIVPRLETFAMLSMRYG